MFDGVETVARNVERETIITLYNAARILQFSYRSSVCHFSGRLAGARERLGESRISPANVLGADRDRVAIRIAFACSTRRRKELPGGRSRISGGKGKLVTSRAESP
jgi:hypothetical protein